MKFSKKTRNFSKSWRRCKLANAPRIPNHTNEQIQQRRGMTDQIEEIKKQILNTLKPHGVKKASLFGSIVRGKLTDKSDIERIIEREEKL